MPISYKIDTARRLVVFRMSGHVTGQELLDSLRQLWAEPNHEAALPRLIDGTEVTSADVSAETVRAIAREWSGRLNARSALLATTSPVYGLLRMYELYADDPKCQVFTERAEALRWLADE